MKDVEIPAGLDIETLIEGSRMGYRLASVHRWGNPVERKPDIESTTEHTWNGMHLMDVYWHIEGFNHGVDLSRAKHLLQYHDLDEAGKKGDVLQTVKTQDDESVDYVEIRRELSGLPESLVDFIVGCQQEFEEQKTIDAQFALAIDKLEPSYQMYFAGIARVVNVPPEFLPHGAWHGFVQDARREATAPFDVMHSVGNFLEARIRTRLDQFPRMLSQETATGLRLVSDNQK